MPYNKAFLAEFHYETGLTRKILQRIPADKLSWAPHGKSMSLARLATHIADIHGWPVFMLGTSELDMATTSLAPVPLDTTEEVLQRFEQNISNTVAAMQDASDEQTEMPWTLRHGEQTIFSMPRKQVLRGMILSHVVHHRGQLSVYLRLLDVPVPFIYGPSADEQVF